MVKCNPQHKKYSKISFVDPPVRGAKDKNTEKLGIVYMYSISVQVVKEI